ncbi:integrin alpha-E [Protopterus annectens]|uniref:integrin alpha-E n=1 Tax=Protopterus annectens TaxID=7888 RepID=UPI001CF93A3C|nr:integrin alpha-E [Protopterus annectens]
MKSILQMVLFLALLDELRSFNIDLNRKWIIPGKKEAFFGHKVVQYSNKEGNGVLVTAPLTIRNKRLMPEIHKCTVRDKKCNIVNLEVPEKKRMRPGLFLTRNPRDYDLLVCQQYKSFRFKSSVEELNGICSVLNSDLSKRYNFTPVELVEKTLKEINNNNNNNNKNEMENIMVKPDSISINNNNNNNNVNNSRRREQNIMEERLEVVFVLDGSDSIKSNEFEMAKNFITNVMTRLSEASPDCAFAFVQHGSKIQTELSLQESQNTLQAIERVRSISQLHGLAKTASAIKQAIDILTGESGSRENATKTMIVLSDGIIPGDPVNLLHVVDSPQMAAIQRFFIGIGNAFKGQTALTEAHQIASAPITDHLFLVDKYADLEQMAASIVENLLQRTDKERLEVAFVLDGSGSIASEDFQQAKDFITKIMTSLWKDVSKCLFAVVQYGDEIKTELSFNESYKKQQALERVQGIIQLGKVTKTASAIQHTLNIYKQNGLERHARKIMIVLTDGEIFLDPLDLATVINSTGMADIESFAIGVGIHLNRNAVAELQLIATDPDQDHMFLVKDYTVLEGLVKTIKGRILMTKTKDTLLFDLNKNNNNNEDTDDEDPEKATEIAIVLDGSGSIEKEDFEKAKTFISNMTREFWQTCTMCEFAVVQYGEEIRTEFDFQDSRRSTEVVWEKLKNITQLGKVTKTASALKHVLDNIFSEKHGSRKDSTKIIIVLTDGEIFLDPLNLTYVLNLPKMAEVNDRYAIGVGKDFNKPSVMEQLTQIAKYNDSDHVFRVDNYEGLNSLLSKLGKNIVGIEGTKGSTLQLELAQAGFSASILDDGGILIGAVGAFDWNGGLILQKSDREIHFLNDSNIDEDISKKFGYLGYSVASIRRNDEYKYLYVSGAPRHSGTGKVLVFRQDKWTVGSLPDLNGEQVGSYFGAELCALDINKDNVTDFLLVGAPFFHNRGEEGKVYVYRITSEDVFTNAMELKGLSKYYFSRFGFAISNIGDINKDGYNDIAIGAPLEEDLPGTSGSIYIFNGQKNGLMHTFSQHIAAADVGQGLMYFGQSIDGGFDVTSDGLDDIAVGAYGNLIVLRSRPVITLRTVVTFSPPEVPLSFQMAKESSDNVITAKVCFKIEPEFKDLFLSYIDYTMELDVREENKRIQFANNERQFSLRYIESKCWSNTLFILPCTSDCFSDIIIGVKYSLRNSDETRDNPAPVLDKFSTLSNNFSLPFEKDCGTDSVCEADLFLDARLPQNMTVIIGLTKSFPMDIQLENKGEDAYITTMIFTYPQFMIFNQVSKTEVISSPSIKCTDSRSGNLSDSELICNIGHPVFKAKTQLNFTVSWQLDSKNVYPEDAANISIAVNSTNKNKAGPISELRCFPVQHILEVDLKQPSPYSMNISKEKSYNLSSRFEIKGSNPFGAKIDTVISIPVRVQDKTVLTVKSVEGTQGILLYEECPLSPVTQT